MKKPREYKRRSTRRRGSLLIETMIGITIIMIMLLGMTAAYTMTLSSLLEVKDRENATRRAFMVLNELESVEFVSMDQYINSMDLDDENYNIVLAIEPTTITENTRSADVRVSVTHKSRNTPVVLRRELSSGAYRSAGMN